MPERWTSIEHRRGEEHTPRRGARDGSVWWMYVLLLRGRTLKTRSVKNRSPLPQMALMRSRAMSVVDWGLTPKLMMKIRSDRWPDGLLGKTLGLFLADAPPWTTAQ